MKTFGPFELDARRRTLRSAERPVRLNGQALDLLCLLLERPGELVTREDIERALWPDRHVNADHSLDVIVSRLRGVLDDRGSAPRYIETVPRRGYRFIEPVVVKVEGEGDAPGATTQARHWSRRLATYAAIALLAAILAVAFVRTRYDKVVTHPRTSTASSAPHR